MKFIMAIGSYAALILGNYYFVTSRMGKRFDLWNILSLSIAFGMCTFAVFDFTIAVVFKHWDMLTCIYDTFFGAFVHSLAAISVGYFRELTTKGQENHPHSGERHTVETKY